MNAPPPEEQRHRYRIISAAKPIRTAAPPITVPDAPAQDPKRPPSSAEGKAFSPIPGIKDGTSATGPYYIHEWGGLKVADKKLSLLHRTHVGFLPHGLAIGKAGIDATTAPVFVGLQATGEIAELNLTEQRVVRHFAVGHWPRYLTASLDGKRLAVGLSGESAIAVVDLAAGEVLYREPLSGGINIGHLQTSADGLNVYFPWMIYRSNPINVRNIRRGWILASRAARVRLDGPADRAAPVGPRLRPGR